MKGHPGCQYSERKPQDHCSDAGQDGEVQVGAGVEGLCGKN